MTAITEQTRNASTAANALKSVGARLRGLDDEGNEVKDLVPKLNSEFKALGVELMDTNGEIKSTFDVTKDLAKVWPTLTDTQKTYIAELSAGKFQLNNFLSLMNNFDVALSATETAMNSAGSATKENEKYLDSIKGKVQNLKSQFQKLANSLIDSGLIKGLTDFGTILLKIANTGVGQTVIKLTALIIIFNLTKKSIIAVKTELIKMGLVTSDLNKKLLVYSANIKIAGNESLKSAAKFKLSNKAMSGSAKGLEDVGSSMTKVTSTSSLLGNKITGLGKSFKAFGSSAVKSIGSIAASIPIAGWIAIGVVAAIGAAVVVSKKLEEQVEKNYKNAKSKLKESKKDVSDTEKEIKETQDKMTKLEGKDSLTDVETSKLNIYKMQLAELKSQLKTQKSQVKESQKDLDKAKEKLEIQTKSKWDDKLKYSRKDDTSTFSSETKNNNIYKGTLSYETKGEATGKKTVTDYKEDLKTLKENNNLLQKSTEAEKKKKNINEENKKITEATNGLIKNSLGVNNKDNLTLDAKIKGMKEAGKISKDVLPEKEKKKLNETNEKIMKKMNDRAKDLLEASKDTNLSDKDRLDYYQEYLDLLKDIDPDKWMKTKVTDMFDTSSIMDATNGTEKFSDALKDVRKDGKVTKKEVQSLKDQFPEFNKYLEDNKISVNDAANGLTKYAEEAEKTAIANGLNAKSLDSINSSLDTIQANYETLTSAVDEYNQQGYLSIDTLQSLATAGADYYQYLFDENGQIKLNEQGFIDLANAQLTYLQVQQAQKLLDFTSTLSAEGNQCVATANNVDTLTKALQENNAAKAANIAMEMTGGDFTPEEKAAIEKRAESSAAFIQQIQKTAQATLSGGLKKTSTAPSSSKKDSSSSKSEKEWWEKELQNLKDQFDYNETTIEEYIGGLSNLLGRVQQGTEAWKKINEELQKQRLSKVEDDYKRGTISLKQYINELKNLQGAYKAGTDAWLELVDKIKSGLKDLLDEQKDAYETAHDATMKIIDDEIDKINEQRDATEEYYDDLIEDKEKANEETEKEIELAKLQEALENARREKTKKVFVEGLGWQWQTDKTAIDEAQKDLDDFMSEQEIKDLEDAKDKALEVFDEQLEAWDKYKESWDDVVDEYENQQARLILQQTLGADAEAKILQQRLDVLEKFRNEYNSTLSQIDALEKTSSTNTGALNSIQSNIKGYANGIENGVVDYTGYAKLHGSPTNPEYVLNNGQMKNLLSSLTKPGYSSNIKGTTSSSNTYNFGNIELPNVTNANQFISELKSVVNVTKHQ